MPPCLTIFNPDQLSPITISLFFPTSSSQVYCDIHCARMGTIFGARELSYEDIKKYTSNFSEERFISKFMKGTIYRGTNGGENYTVKVWDNYKNRGCGLFVEEFYLFNHGKFKGHPKTIGYCDDGENPCVVVYDLNPLDTLHNLIPKDNFSWVDRIKVALGFASSLSSFHGACSSPFKIRGIDATLILCDQDYTPILYDFGLIVGGFFPETWKANGSLGCYGYLDPYPYIAAKGIFSTKMDVFAYGVVLLGLITKRVVNAEKDTESDFVYLWAEKEYKRKRRSLRRPSLADVSFELHPYFNSADGRMITKLALNCINSDPDKRPDIDEVIKRLKNLTVVRKHGDESGINLVLKRL